MGFFEEELQKIFGKDAPITDIRFTGRACIGRLGETTNVKLEFVIQNYMEHYGGIRATVFNRNEGKIDSGLFLIEDILGKKPGVSASYINGIPPHIAVYNGKAEWYVYKPTAEDFRAIAAAVNSYLEVFLEPDRQTRETEKALAGRSDGYTSVMDTIRADKAKPRQPRKPAQGKKIKDTEL